MNHFFVSCPVHFEKELIRELESFWFLLMDLDGLPTREEVPEFEIHTGGVEFRTKIHLGYQINFFSKIALRVLIRVDGFEARYFDQFEKGLNQVSFEKYLEPQKLHVQIESAKSRLFHEGNLQEAAGKVLLKKGYPADNKALQSLFIRLVKDKVIISLDTTGEHLHFRGYRKFQGEAPIRENLASLILQISGLDKIQDQVLFDPYCGSGTFFFESQLSHFPNFSREFSFLKFKNVPAIYKSSSWKKNYRWIQSQQQNEFIGIEKNSETLKKMNQNIEVFNEKFFPIKITSFVGDSENYDLKNIETFAENRKVSIVTNPPYGERSEMGNVVKSIERYENLKTIDKIVVIHPEKWKFHFKKMKLRQSIPFSNQGLKTVVGIFEI